MEPEHIRFYDRLKKDPVRMAMKREYQRKWVAAKRKRLKRLKEAA